MLVHHFELDDTAFVITILHFFGISVCNHDLVARLGIGKILRS